MNTFYGSPRLDNARNGLDEPKGDRQSQNQQGYPECIPLYSFAVIIPPRPERLRLGVVESLLQDYKAISPIMELLDLSCRST